jgi:hypothetical protein
MPKFSCDESASCHKYLKSNWIFRGSKIQDERHYPAWNQRLSLVCPSSPYGWVKFNLSQSPNQQSWDGVLYEGEDVFLSEILCFHRSRRMCLESPGSCHNFSWEGRQEQCNRGARQKAGETRGLVDRHIP